MKSLLLACLILLSSQFATAVDITNVAEIATPPKYDMRKNDFKWFQFNLINSTDNKIPFGLQNDNYFEMEFGGRSGILDLYGFLDVYDIFDSNTSDYHGGDNFFLKFMPRFSLDVMAGKSLALGPFKEWYITTLFYAADRGLFQQYIGPGTDIEVPWFGKVGANLLARYVRENFGAANERRWDGYFLTLNWFTPFYHFQNKSYLTYQGYFDHMFGADEIADDVNRSDSSVGWLNGLFWHTDRYAAGYALKIYQDFALFKDGGIGGDTSGVGHYFFLTYKF
ncbi:Nucleoside-specific channel-forming protein tsx precursor [compost metagenome]